MHKPSEYVISVQKVSIDDKVEARVAELPDLITYGDTYSEAYESILEAIACLQEQYILLDKPFPKPRLI